MRQKIKVKQTEEIEQQKNVSGQREAAHVQSAIMPITYGEQ